MKYYLGVTDNSWFDFLSRRNPEDINFWQPSGNSVFKALQQGAPFFFKLKRPRNHIGGVGFFSSHTTLPLSIAWDTFKERNGTATYAELQSLIQNYRQDRQSTNPVIGCIVLTDPIFFHEKDWLPAPPDWGKSIVQGKGYDSSSLDGRFLWERLEELIYRYTLNRADERRKDILIAEEDRALYGNPLLRKVRLGQGAFRVLVTDAYQRRCGITGEKTLPVLEAAHIKPYSESGPHALTNGLLLRSDMHKLFDSGYLTITTNLKIEISGRIREEFQNGKEYYKYHGSLLQHLPVNPNNLPEEQFIRWHNENIFRA
ncbi:HNH endonuclease [Flaviaesturariibacter amylovorans]|uniref:HNH endonuclease n=1 Tax=Flaviaesturariibacter amylovorans TaxID=1084520 RepID=UPI0031F17A98